MAHINRGTLIPNIQTAVDAYNYTEGSLHVFADVINDNWDKTVQAVNALRADNKLLWLEIALLCGAGVCQWLWSHDQDKRIEKLQRRADGQLLIIEELNKEIDRLKEAELDGEK